MPRSLCMLCLVATLIGLPVLLRAVAPVDGELVASCEAPALGACTGEACPAPEGEAVAALMFDPGTMTSREILHRAFATVPDDFSRITNWPFQHPDETLRYLGGLAVLVATDRESTEFLQKEINPLFDYEVSNLGLADFLSPADSWLVAALPAWYAGSVAAGSEKGQVAAALGVKAAAYSYVYSHLLLKSVTGRNRPDPNLGSGRPTPAPYTDDPYDWGHIHAPRFGTESEGMSFPSFHYTLYFAVARVYEKVYGNGLVPYTLAALALGADMEGHHHWVSDAVAGAVIGYGIGSAVVDNFFGIQDAGGAAAPRAFTIIPQYAGNDSYGLVVQMAF